MNFIFAFNDKINKLLLVNEDFLMKKYWFLCNLYV